jgi:hypothetical protein
MSPQPSGPQRFEVIINVTYEAFNPRHMGGELLELLLFIYERNPMMKGVGRLQRLRLVLHLQG